MSTASSLTTAVAATKNTFAGASTTGLPGPVAGGLSAALSSLGALVLGFALSSLRAAPGFGMSACGLGAAPAPPVSWSPNNPAYAGPAHFAAPVEKQMVPVAMMALPAPPKPLPPGWSRHGPDEKGDVWYSGPDGSTSWDPPGFAPRV